MSSDDDKDLMCKAFAIDNHGEDLNLDIPPTSGMEYLRRVQMEAKQCPSIVVSDIDANLFQEHQTFKVSSTSGLHPAPTGYSPSIKWQREQTAKFSSNRRQFTKTKSKMRKEKKTRRDLPNLKNVEEWCKLCFGYFRPLRPTFPAPDSLFGGESGGEGQTPPGNIGTPPLLSIVAAMNQQTVIQVLEYHINWFEATGFTTEQGRWFYALLTCLEKPLDPEACALLRNLARNCANLRASLECSTDPRLAPLNLLICLVARYFDQSDLADR